MKSLATLLLLVLTSSLVARADDASHRAKAQEMMSILHSRQMVENIADNLKKQFPLAANNVIGTDATPEKKAHAADFVKRADQLIDAQLAWTTVQPAFTDIYIKNFTEEQLDAIIAFYKSPTGLALLTIMPNINSQISQFGNERINAMKPQLKQLYDDFRKSDGAATPAPQSPSAPK